MSHVTYLGLDVHKDSIAVAVLRSKGREPDQRIIPNSPEALRRLISKLGSESEIVACYEAGPTGYDTYRLLESLGVSCEVIAPAMIPRRPGQRVKTDRLDATNLVRLHRAGELTPVRIPTAEEEALRDFIRAREHLKADLRRIRQRIRAFLARQGRHYPAKTARWGKLFTAWVRSQRFDQPTLQLTFNHLIAELDSRTLHLEQVDREIEEAASRPPLAEPVKLLRSFRGIDTLTAVTLVTEVGDFRRFPTAASFMGYTGLVPSEHSSGKTEWRGSITKVGNAHIRRALVEASWSYRHRPAITKQIKARSQGLSPDVLAYSWAAQIRLCNRYRKLAASRGFNKAVVAVARELSGFVWGLMNGKTSVA
jgi:transposase